MQRANIKVCSGPFSISIEHPYYKSITVVGRRITNTSHIPQFLIRKKRNCGSRDGGLET